MGLRYLTLLLLQLVVIGMALADLEDSSLGNDCTQCDEASFKGSDENTVTTRNADDLKADTDTSTVGADDDTLDTDADASTAVSDDDDGLDTDADANAVTAGPKIESETESSTDIEPDTSSATTLRTKPVLTKVDDDKEPKLVIPKETDRYPGPLLPGSPPDFLRPISQRYPYAGPPRAPAFWPQYPESSWQRLPPVQINPTENEVDKRVDNTKLNESTLPPPTNFLRYPIYRIPFSIYGPVIPPYYQPTGSPSTADTKSATTNKQVVDDSSSTNIPEDTQTIRYEPRIFQPYDSSSYLKHWRPYPGLRPVYY